MALWLCTDCSAAYAVGQSACPNCGSTAYLEDHPMPKITVHGGASNQYDPDTQSEPDALPELAAQPAEAIVPPMPEEEPSPGTSSETSSPKADSSPSTSASEAPSRARMMENPS